MKNSFISTANRHQIKWFLVLNLISSISILSFLTHSPQPIKDFAAVQLLYVMLIFKQFFIGSGFLNLASNETGETADNLIYASYGFLFPALAVEIVDIYSPLEMLLWFAIAYISPALHGFLYQIFLQK